MPAIYNERDHVCLIMIFFFFLVNKCIEENRFVAQRCYIFWIQIKGFLSCKLTCKDS